MSFRSISHFIARLLNARDGGVAIYVSMVSVIIMGFSALVLDAGRVYTLQTELQNAADAAALAGAAELDLKTTSITRARAAAKTAFVNNLQTYGSGGESITIQDSNIRFLSTLPADDDTPIPSSAVTTDPTKATFIEVTPSVREVDYLLVSVIRINGTAEPIL
jgi:Flp pilus assembly protein TadG